jgi:hypothetical protein
VFGRELFAVLTGTQVIVIKVHRAFCQLVHANTGIAGLSEVVQESFLFTIFKFLIPQFDELG